MNVDFKWRFWTIISHRLHVGRREDKRDNLSTTVKTFFPRRFIESMPRWPSRIVVAIGLVKLALAGVNWLRTGTWKPQTGVAALHELGFSQTTVNAWLAAPRSWW